MLILKSYRVLGSVVRVKMVLMVCYAELLEVGVVKMVCSDGLSGLGW